MLPKTPVFWLLNAAKQRISQEFTTPAAVVDFATRQGLLHRSKILVGGYATCGHVPFALFLDHFRRGLLPEGATLLHFNIPLELRHKRPLHALAEEVVAIELGRLTELRRPAEYISEVYRSGSQRGEPKLLHTPRVDTRIGWTQQELLLANPCYHGKAGDKLRFENVPGVEFLVQAVTIALDEDGRCWEWVLQLQELVPTPARRRAQLA